MLNSLKKYNDVILVNPREDNLMFGSTETVQEVLIDNGDWTPYLVEKEVQTGLYFDTWNCVAESATNVLEILFKYYLVNNLLSTDDLDWLTKKGYLKNGEINFSARFVGSLAGTKVGKGNDGDTVGRAICKYGLIPENKYPFDLRERDAKINNETVYYQKPPQELLDLALEFIERFPIKFKFVETERLSGALMFSPVQSFVNAWYEKDGKYFNPDGSINHAVCRKKINAKQIFDTYDPFEKTLTDDYNYYYWSIKYLIEIKNTMSNVKLVKDENSSAVGFFVPADSPEALISLGKNYGITISKKGDNKVDWDSLNLQGKIILNQ